MLVDEVLHAFGRLDVWVCSSGLLGPPSINDTAPSSRSSAHGSQDQHDLAGADRRRCRSERGGF